MRKLLIIGAGAIGRGYLPWVFEPGTYEWIFIDTNPKIIDQMQKAGHFATYRVKNDQLEKRVVPVHQAYLPRDFNPAEHSDIEAVFVNVGPRNCVQIGPLVEGLSCPIILCENDPATVDQVKGVTSHPDVYFAVPDVITSNTAPQHLLDEDPIALVTEDGVLFIDQGAKGIQGDIQFCSTEELSKQWTAKLYLHNTPHCVAAYLGALAGVQYVHEAMAIPEINTIVEGSMLEMLNSLKLRWEIPHSFLEWYAAKELSRFRCKQLFDPISRVAREPLRKLELEGRLVGAAQICISLGFIPQNILVGIGSALLFDNSEDADHHMKFMRRALEPDAFLTHVLGLRRGEALEIVLKARLDQIVKQLEELSRGIRGRRGVYQGVYHGV